MMFHHHNKYGNKVFYSSEHIIRTNIHLHSLQLALPQVVESLTHVNNLCILQNIFPSALNAAKFCPLPKTKDLSEPNNSRQIFILSILTKPLERHIHRHLTRSIEYRKLFHLFQSGIRL